MAVSEQQRKANLRLGLILASVAVIFAVGFVTKIIFFSH
ncbi:MAG: cytochrome oxidase small assembly protein [Hylemonella sp.]|nr:cytochrome oxidase small assembly protein [Hylemonella sp.]